MTSARADTHSHTHRTHGCGTPIVCGMPRGAGKLGQARVPAVLVIGGSLRSVILLCQARTKNFTGISSLIPHNCPLSKVACGTHFTAEQTEVRRGEVDCPETPRHPEYPGLTPELVLKLECDPTMPLTREGRLTSEKWR